MKKFLSLILILSASVPFYAQDESETISTDVYDFESWTRDWYEPLKEAVVFADACKLRSEPTSGSEMLAKLLIGDKVKILKEKRICLGRIINKPKSESFRYNISCLGTHKDR